ncbi:MAG: oxidoreductase [Novosphingobium sp.]|nr:oxidoreductase [Novosphingobium sp.]
MATAPVRVALVGYGLAGREFHAPLIGATQGLALTAVVSSQADRIAAELPGVAILADLAVALADPSIDLVVIASPDQFHAPQALAALAAGKHVVIDKPFAPTLGEAQAVTAQAERSGKVLTIFHNRRWDADFLTLKRLIEARELGEIRQFESHFDRYRPEVGERWKDRRAGGVWQDLGPHLIDQAIRLFGLPDAVFADLAIQKPGGASSDYAHVVLRHGTMRTILHITQSAHAHDLRFVVHGTAGSYLKHGIDPQEDQSKAGMLPGDPGWAIDLRDGILTRYGADGDVHSAPVPNLPGDYLAFYRELHAAIGGCRPNPVPPGQALEVMAVLAAGSESARTGSWVVPATDTN